MKDNTKKKIKWVAGIVCLSTLIAIMVVSWIHFYYLPMRDAKPIMKQLRADTFEDFRRARKKGYEDHLPLRGIGAYKVKKQILESLSHSENMYTLETCFFFIMQPHSKTGIKFQSEKERKIIERATQFYNENWSRNATFNVVKRDDGAYGVFITMPAYRSY